MSEILIGVLRMPPELFWSDDEMTRLQHDNIRREAADEIERLQAENEALRRDVELWELIHDEIHRRADKEHALADRCDFDVTIMYEDYAAIDAAYRKGGSK